MKKNNNNWMLRPQVGHSEPELEWRRDKKKENIEWQVDSRRLYLTFGLSTEDSLRQRTVNAEFGIVRKRRRLHFLVIVKPLVFSEVQDDSEVPFPKIVLRRSAAKTSRNASCTVEEVEIETKEKIRTKLLPYFVGFVCCNEGKERKKDTPVRMSHY